MINWQEIRGLHVISKLDEVLSKWFGVELVFADSHYKVRSEHLDKEFDFNSPFFKLQMQMNFGHEYVSQDIERITDNMSSGDKDTDIFDSFFENVKLVGSRVVVDGEYLGTVFAYPFVFDSFTAEDSDHLVEKMVECGATKDDAKTAIESLKRMNKVDIEYLQELIAIVADEVVTFHSEISKREERIQELSSELGEKFRYHSMIGKSKKMQQIYNLLTKIASSEASVFIQGANGTGKELVAKAVHFDSQRRDNVFLAINCSAFNDNLLDSELFGHVKGAFTGAIKDKRGLFEQASGGTLFLDEIGDTSLSMQVKLLRVLQEGTFLPVGATSPKKTDVRVIAATNRNLKEMMQKGEFREDLYYRLNVINVNLPPLCERADDIPLLMDYFLDKRCAQAGMPLKTISKKCMEVMLNYPWPGNVRELENEIERLVVLSGQDKTVTPDLLSPRLLEFGGSPAVANRGINTGGNLKKALEELEIIMIREGLKRCNFNKSKLSKELGISRASLIMKVEKYGLDKRNKQAVNE